MLELVQTTYRTARPDLTPAEVAEVIAAAIARAREKHPDFDHFAPAVEYLATVFFTDHVTMPLDAYLETLYCGAKHGDYSKEWRAKLRTMKAEAAPAPA